MQRADVALDELCVAVRDAQGLLDAVLDRAAVIRQGRAQGRRYSELVPAEAHPFVVELLTEVLDELSAAGSAFRRAEARELYADGLSQEAIAGLFGVTRQRVSVLLKDESASQPARGA